MLENETEIIPENEAQVDELLNQIDEPTPATADENPAEPVVAAPVAADEYTFTVGGKEIKANREKMIKWAQMGYDAPAKIGHLSKEIESWKAKEAEFKAYETKYGEIDKYVREKPDFWNHVTKTWNEREQLLNDQNNPLATTVSQLQKQVQDLVSYKSQIEQRQQEVAMAREDQAYVQELEGIRTKYPQIDFATQDENGKSLEYKVLEYANQNGIRKFSTAFKDFYHDELVKLGQEQAKENIVKEKQKNSKLGILGVTPTPTKKISEDVKGKSYNDLVKETLAEYNIS